ncbi:F0F1 ATP synthase subunit B [Candidatus Kaiserbacteria bacterium]|nr:F0F1 ATP synthase subunit B [Candidatus Kaiserbacteria bacterium]
MEDLLHAFGIDGHLILVQVVNFAILAGLLWYFLYTPVLNLLKEREEKIARGVKDAEDAEKLKANAEENRKERLTAAQREAEEVSDRARTRATEKSAEIVGEAETKADNILKDAQARGEALAEKAQKESEAEIAKAAVLAAEKVLIEK